MSHTNSPDRAGLLRVVLHRLHANERGNLSILLLMVVWAFVVMIAMVWNTGEYATRRRHVQVAADSAAHAGNTWVSRTTNLTSATNLVIAENGSAEVILRSVTPTRQFIQQRFESERARSKQLLDGSRRSEPEKQIPDCEYFEELVGFAAWQGNGRGDQRAKELATLAPQVVRLSSRVMELLPGNEATRLQKQVTDGLQDNTAALTWLTGTYLGQNGPPVTQWITSEVRPRLNDILKTLDVEQQSLDQFTAQTNPAIQSMSPQDLRNARQELFDYEAQIRALTPKVVEEQRSALATFYKCDLTFATPGRSSIERESAAVEAPLLPASAIEDEFHTDSIRQQYPQATFARFGTSSPVVTVDPININLDDSVIWHPGSSASAPPGITMNGKQFTGVFRVGGGEWGHVPCAPLSRFFNDRVSRDMQGLRREPQAIDQTRTSLGGRILPVPPDPVIVSLPKQFTVPGPGGRTVQLPPPRIPQLPTPDGLTPQEVEAINALNTRTAQFDSDVREYVRDLRGLQSAVARMYDHLSNLAQHAAQNFADLTWRRYVEENRQWVLRSIGADKQFMVLSTYKLRSIPDWAVSDMRADVQERVYRAIYDRNLGRVTQDARSKLQNWAQNEINAQAQQGGRRPQQNQASAFANRYASQVARYVVAQAARTISQEVAAEWVLRPWPYEIAPPEQPVPPTGGISDDERKHYFTFLAAAITTDDTAPRPLLAKYFTTEKKPFVAFAQGETFNWMEFNERFGAGDRFAQMTFFGHGDQGGSPRPWRLSTTGGWMWQPRLAVSDALAEAIDDGTQFRDFLEKGGVSGNDEAAAKTLATH